MWISRLPLSLASDGQCNNGARGCDTSGEMETMASEWLRHVWGDGWRMASRALWVGGGGARHWPLASEASPSPSARLSLHVERYFALYLSRCLCALLYISDMPLWVLVSR